MGMFLYVSYVFRINVVFKYENIFAGVKFVGDPIFYAGILFLFGLVLFYMFMDTEKYVNGYGILHVTRNRKRYMIVGKIVFNHIKGLVQIIFSLIVIYFLEAKVLHMKETESDIRQFIYYIIKSIFSTGANISKEKDKNKDAVMSGLMLGTIVSIFIFTIIIFSYFVI